MLAIGSGGGGLGWPSPLLGSLVDGEEFRIERLIETGAEGDPGFVTGADGAFDCSDGDLSFGGDVYVFDEDRARPEGGHLGTRGRISMEIPINIPTDQSTHLSLITGESHDPATKTIEFDPVNQYTLQAEAFAAAVLDGESLPDSGATAVGNMRVIDKVFAAVGPSGWA